MAAILVRVQTRVGQARVSVQVCERLGERAIQRVREKGKRERGARARPSYTRAPPARVRSVTASARCIKSNFDWTASWQLTDTLETLAARLQQELPSLPQFKLSRDPAHKDYLGPANASVKQLGLQHGDRIFADHSAEAVADAAGPAAPSKSHIVGMTLSGKEVVEIVEASPAKTARVPAKDVKLDEVDEILAKEDGREQLKDQESKRGFGSASIDSMAVEPYDERLLKQKDVKLMSFHAHLRKLKSVQGGGKFSELKRHDFGTYGEVGGKGGQEKGWGERAVAMSRIPKPMTLNRQKFRHVDRGLCSPAHPVFLYRTSQMCTEDDPFPHTPGRAARHRAEAAARHQGRSECIRIFWGVLWTGVLYGTVVLHWSLSTGVITRVLHGAPRRCAPSTQTVYLACVLHCEL